MLSFPANPTNGTEYTDTNGKVWVYDGIKWNIATSTGTKEFTGVKVSLANQYFLTNTLSAVTFDTIDYDTANFYNTATPTKLIVPRTGYYRINAIILSGQEGFGAAYSVDVRRNNQSLATDLIGSFQAAVYDQIFLLNVGDEIEIFAAEIEAIGSLVEGTYLEMQLQGYTFGGAITPGFEFSGARVQLSTNLTTTSTSTAIAWDDIIFNINANEAGDLYWDNQTDTRLTIATTAYYRLRAFFETGVDGSTDSYELIIKKSGVELETVLLGANDTADIDATYEFTATDYLEVFVRNIDNVGTIISNNTFFEVTRLGV
jgi:hypothetical protein